VECSHSNHAPFSTLLRVQTFTKHQDSVYQPAPLQFPPQATFETMVCIEMLW